MSDPILGEVAIFAGNFNPSGWAYCQGQLLQIAQYSAVYSLLGTMYGGDGRTTFGLPDLRGRCAVGYGSGAPGRTARNFADSGGSETVALGTNEMPAHNHAATSQVSGNVTVTAILRALGAAANGVNPLGGVLAQQGAATPPEQKVYSRSAATVDMHSSAIAASAAHDLAVATNVGPAGSGAAHNNMSPWLCLGYIIALQGIYPSRD